MGWQQKNTTGFADVIVKWGDDAKKGERPAGEDSAITGVFLRMAEVPGQGFDAIYIKSEGSPGIDDGLVVSMGASYQLGEAFAEIVPGTKVMVVYGGKTTTKAKRTVKTFEIFEDDDTAAMARAAGGVANGPTAKAAVAAPAWDNTGEEPF
jgi:hypothetical protein